MFYVVPVATNVKTIVLMGLLAILGCNTGSSRLCNLFMYIGILCHNPQHIQTMFIVASLHYRSGSILVRGWTMMYKWGHPVATLPSDGGNYTSLSQNDANSANHLAYATVVSAQMQYCELRDDKTLRTIYVL
eukprot:387442-Pleurochrysis_carterae.AAC.1